MIGITQIGESFKTLFSTLRKPATVLPSIIMLCAMVRRPGLSCMVSTSNVLQDIAKRGCPTENLPDGSPNLMNELVASMVCEVYRALKEDANIQIALPPGAFTINATGGNAGGPVNVTGTNITPGSGVGLMQ
jgi:hypothetical protein